MGKQAAGRALPFRAFSYAPMLRPHMLVSHPRQIAAIALAERVRSCHVSQIWQRLSRQRKGCQGYHNHNAAKRSLTLSDFDHVICLGLRKEIVYKSTDAVPDFDFKSKGNSTSRLHGPCLSRHRLWTLFAMLSTTTCL
jgi:hypothetical protein